MKATTRCAAALAAVTVACAPATGAPARPVLQPEQTTIESPTQSESVTLHKDPAESAISLSVSPARVWTALQTAYTSLPIPVQTLDSSGRFILGTAAAYRQFLRNPVSRFLDCGTSLVGPTADTYRLQIRVASRVDSAGPSTSYLRTRVDATGSGSGTTARCSTTGSLERLVEEQVKELLGVR